MGTHKRSPGRKFHLLNKGRYILLGKIRTISISVEPTENTMILTKRDVDIDRTYREAVFGSRDTCPKRRQFVGAD
jgi:hypothetical protein